MGGVQSSDKYKNENYSEIFCLYNDKWCIVKVQYRKLVIPTDVYSHVITFLMEPNSTRKLNIDTRDINEISVYEKGVLFLHISNCNNVKSYRIYE